MEKNRTITTDYLIRKHEPSMVVSRSEGECAQGMRAAAVAGANMQRKTIHHRVEAMYKQCTYNVR